MKRVLVTGGSRGLGLEFVRQLLARGDRVAAGVREVDAPALRALGDEHGARLSIHHLDVRDPASIERCASDESLVGTGLDLLVNNAGIHAGSRDVAPDRANLTFGHLEPEGILDMIRVNAIGPVLVAQAFADRLASATAIATDGATDGTSAPPLILNITSRKGSIGAKEEGGNYGYAASKAALNLMTRLLAHDLGSRATVVAVHPGWVRTTMGGPDAELAPEESVAAVLALADRLTHADRGRFLRWDGEEHPW